MVNPQLAVDGEKNPQPLPLLLLQQNLLISCCRSVRGDHSRPRLVKAKWATSENNRRAKYYELTARGRKQVETEMIAWRKLTHAIDRILDMA